MKTSALASFSLLLMACVGTSSAPSSVAIAQSPAELEIELANDGDEEQRAREQLRRIVRNFDLSPWLFTRRVRVEAGVIPHSHPVLTVNTRYLDNDTAQVATFVHEQLHWFFVEHESRTDSAMAELARRYPDAPDRPPEGARNKHSTYLHLLVCTLEYDAMRAMVGDEGARRTLGGWRHYRWVYRTVLEQPDSIRRVLRAHGLDAPRAGRNGSSRD
ncbi:MAG TPA: hypothetical protein VJ672_15910 [Gemmatimonadaceae bacterium]|nr:hypothetical protein [Gemmatimonadaceae bacterium]